MAETPRRLRRALRSPWTPAAVAAAAAVLIAAWWAPEEVADVQQRNLRTLIAGGVAALLLLLWTVFLSPLPRRARWAAGAAALIAALVLRIEGTSGDLVPVLRPRWAGRPSPPSAAAPASPADPSRAVDFPRFLGPRGDGVVEGPGLLGDWSARPPRLLWKRTVGEGWSGFAVAGGRAVTQEQEGDEECVVAYELATGRVLWRHADAARYETTLGGVGPRATPTIEGGRVYTLGATGLLNCLDLETGRRFWSADIAREAGASVPDWGYAGSPLLEGAAVVVQPAGLAAYERSSGKRLWAAEAGRPSYASPAVAVLGGRRQIVALSLDACDGHDPATGGRLWRYPWRGEQPKAAPPVAIGDDRLVISGGYGVGADAFRIGARGPEPLWTSKRLKSKFASMVLRDGMLYGLDDGRLACVRADTGERLWSGTRYGHGQVLLAGDLLLISAEDGTAVLADADPAAFRERARARFVEGKGWNPPALAGPYLLLRTEREAACVELPVR